MKELTKYLRPAIIFLSLPYALLLFTLIYRLEFEIQAPGGISDVESLIEVDYEVDDIKGSFSSTYIISFNRPTIFQFVISDFSVYNEVNIIPEYYRHYTDTETRQISFLQKMTSVDAAVMVAYQHASAVNADVQIQSESFYDVVLVAGKAEDLSNYDAIGLGDEFISMVGNDDQIITDYGSLSQYMDTGQTYAFTFENSDGQYQVDLSREDITDNRLILRAYTLVDADSIYPQYRESDSNIGGPSGGLLQTLSIYNMLVKEDLTKGYKIAGTGTIRYDGSVGYVGGIKQKIATAYVNKVDFFFIPDIDERYSSHNYIEALAACEEFGIDPEGWLIPVSTVDEAIAFLEGLAPNE